MNALKTSIIALFTAVLLVNSNIRELLLTPNDHGSAARYAQLGMKELPSNAVLFTASLDPLSEALYMQQVEHFRDDVRVISRNHWDRKAYLQSKLGYAGSSIETEVTVNPKSLLRNLKSNGTSLYWEGFESPTISGLQLHPAGLFFHCTLDGTSGKGNSYTHSQAPTYHIEEEVMKLAQKSDLLGRRMMARWFVQRSNWVLHYSRDADKAQSLLENAIRINATDSVAVNNLVALYAQQGHLSKAIILLKGYLSRYPGTSDLYFNYALLSEAVSEPKSALHFYEKSSKLAPLNQQRAIAYRNAVARLTRP